LDTGKTTLLTLYELLTLPETVEDDEGIELVIVFEDGTNADDVVEFTMK
jgi:hypothetical protein